MHRTSLSVKIAMLDALVPVGPAAIDWFLLLLYFLITSLLPSELQYHQEISDNSLLTT